MDGTRPRLAQVLLRTVQSVALLTPRTARQRQRRARRQSKGSRPLLVRSYLIGIRITTQHGACFIRTDTNLGNELHERLGIAQRSPLGKVGLEEPFLSFLLETMGGRQVDQAVSIERIAILRLSQVILQPLLGRNGAHPLIRRRGLREMHAVFLRQDLVDRLPWVKLVAASGDLDLLAMRKVGQGRLKAALADVTPGAGHI